MCHLLRLQRGAVYKDAEVDLFEHALQAASRAYRDGASEEMVVCALLHDVGEMLSPLNHSDVAASILRPYISPEAYWVIAHHDELQHEDGRLQALLTDAKSLLLDGADNPPENALQACVDFCERWDLKSFDPAYPSMALDQFEPMLRRVFSRTPYSMGQTRQS